MMLKAIFYARFHPERGPSVVHQYPNDAVVRPTSSAGNGLFSFSDISSYVIPPYEACNRPLSICTNGYQILGFPISLEDAKYARNRFTFNVCFVLDDSEDTKPWQQVVRKTAAFFKALEEEDGILQAEERLEALKWAGEAGYPEEDVGVVYTLLEGIMEDLNAYGETCVRIDDVHVLNLRIVPSKRNPPKVRAWDVPLLIRSLPDPQEWTWDLTLQRIHEHINGVNHVQRIAELADVEPKLVKKAVKELLYHERALLLDLFHFQAIYAPTADFASFVKDEAMQDECCGYVAIDPAKNIFSSTKTAVMSRQEHIPPAKQTVIELYRSLSPGLTLKDFLLLHEPKLSNIDIRRFITFGFLKGFLRRIHKYLLAIDSQPTPPQARMSNGSGSAHSRSNGDNAKDVEEAWKKAATSSGWPTPPLEAALEISGEASGVDESVKDDQSKEHEHLMQYLNGKHCMDEICVSVHMSETKVLERLKGGRFGEIAILCK